MKTFGLWPALLCTIATFGQSDIDKISSIEQKQYLNFGQSKSLGAESNENIIYHRCEWNIDPAVNYISGKVTTYFIPSVPISFIEFDLDDTMTVDSVVYHGNSLGFNHTADIVHIDFPSSINADITDSIAVYYQGEPVPDSTGFGSFFQSMHDSVPIISTLSEPYGAKDWWPCKQNLKDKIDSIDIIITTPSQYKAASNGMLIEQNVNGSHTTYHWKHRYPIATYLVCLAVTNYSVYYHYVPFGTDTVPVWNYVYPEDSAGIATQTPLVVLSMQLYDSLFGLYPFNKEKYGMVEFSWGGGMEHQTMTFIGQFGFEVIVHELAHHWFGDKVTNASWHDIWIHEGFATYLTALSYLHIAPVWYSRFISEHMGSAVSEPHGSVWCVDTTSVSSIFNEHLSYSKGAMVLHMLRWTLGDSLFFAGLRNYLNDPAEAFSFANTETLERHLEASSNTDLSDFFNQWVYGSGFPSYQIDWTQDFSKHLSITINQTQSDASVTFFNVAIPLEFKNAYNDTILVFNPTSSGQVFSVDLAFEADSLIFDPVQWILSANNTITRLASSDFSVFIYPNPVPDNLQLRYQNSNTGSATLHIYNQLGQMVCKASRNLQAGSGLLDIDVANLAHGVYLLKIRLGELNATATFIR